MQSAGKRGKMQKRAVLPEAVVMEILSKLPVKSLKRFRCVCKHWCSSFQTPYFISKHYLNNLKNDNLNLLKRHQCTTGVHFYALSTDKDQNFSVKENIHLPYFENRAPEVHGPCNGLLCLTRDDKVAIWNPSTREVKVLPKSSVQRPPSVDWTTYGGSSDDSFGFGFDSRTDDYKVVRFIGNHFYHHDTIVQVELYSLKSDSWKEISYPGSNPGGYNMFNNHINGFCYWPEVITRDSDGFILSFDMANEKFSTLPLPESLHVFRRSFARNRRFFELLDFNGFLGAIVYPSRGTEKYFDLWVMNGSWTRKFSIQSVPGVERPLGFWKNGKWFLEGSNYELLLFDPITKELENLGIRVNGIFGKMLLISYVESLVPISGRSEHEEHVTRQSAGDMK